MTIRKRGEAYSVRAHEKFYLGLYLKILSLLFITFFYPSLYPLTCRNGEEIYDKLGKQIRGFLRSVSWRMSRICAARLCHCHNRARILDSPSNFVDLPCVSSLNGSNRRLKFLSSLHVFPLAMHTRVLDRIGRGKRKG